MKRTQFAEETQTFAIRAEESCDTSKADRNALRRLNASRRKLIRSIARVCQLSSDDDVCCVAEYILLLQV